MEEREIIALLVQQDDSGLRAFQTRYGPLIRYIIAPILPDVREQEECFSDVSWKVWNRIETYQADRGSFKSWLTVLTRNTALNRARRNQHPTQQGEELSPELPDKGPVPEEALLHQEQMLNLKRILWQLDEKERILLFRKYYYHQPTAQIAAELGMTERAVEGRLYRLKQKLRDRLGGEDHA